MNPSPSAIHQFHSGSAKGDAITNSMFYIRGILRDLGFESEIYAEHVGPGLEKEIYAHHEYRPSEKQTLLVHHSMGHNVEDWLLSLPDSKTLIYHNITPERYFTSEITRSYIRKGHQQLRNLLPNIQSAIAVSEYNLQDLADYPGLKKSVIPLLFDPDTIRSAPYKIDIARKRGDTYRLLFVGRVLPHKCQDELIELCAHLKQRTREPFELVLVGYTDIPEYNARLEKLVHTYKLQNEVKILGPVCDAELHAWYRASDAFVCLSEHEGFGVPLIEAMLLGVPVFAAASAAIPSTLGNAGVLFPDKSDLAKIAETLLYVRESRALRNQIIAAQNQRVEAFEKENLITELIQHLELNLSSEQLLPPNKSPRKLKIQFEGPAETTYSLAIVNRQIAYALDSDPDCNLSLFLTEGPGNYQPDLEALHKLPQLEKLSKKGKEFARPDVLLRNLYPPRVRDMDGAFNALCFAWEETSVPREWVHDFNRHLDCVFASSEFTKRALVDSGVKIPVIVYGHGSEHIPVTTEKHPDLPKRKFRFLHISSCFPRKGPDVLINAFAKSFEPEDDIELLIKTFSNPHNTIVSDVEKLRTRKGKKPLIRIIEGDLSNSEISSLYNSSDCVVMPSRGEGFGLPLAEAFLHKRPVITTAWGGQLDFCNSENAWLIPFKLRPAKSHLSEPGSIWAEPDVNALSEIFQTVATSSPSLLGKKANAGYEHVTKNLSWTTCAKRILSGIESVKMLQERKPEKERIAWISTWNTHCGIATYSNFLLKQKAFESCDIKIFSDKSLGPFLNTNDASIRCWSQDFNNPYQKELTQELFEYQPNAVVIQFNFGFFSVKALSRLIQDLSDKNIKVIIDFHSTADVNKPDLKTSLSAIKEDLLKCHRLLVHNLSDLDRFQEFGLLPHTTLYPHGVSEGRKFNRKQLKQNLGIDPDAPVIATFGFLLPHKGSLELVKAHKQLLEIHPKAQLLLINARHPDPLSGRYEREINAYIEKVNIKDSIYRFHEFIPDDIIALLLESSDITVFPYRETQESVSGAVRYALTAQSAIISSPVSIFEDLKGTILNSESDSSICLTESIVNMLANPFFMKSQIFKQNQWVKSNSWRRSAERLSGMAINTYTQK